MSRTPLLLVALVACGPKVAPAPAPAPAPPPPPTVVADELNDEAVAGVTDPELARLLHDHWEATMAAYPTWASQLGDRRYDDRLTDSRPGAIADRREDRDAFLARAGAIPSDRLSAADALTLALFVQELEVDQRGDVCRFDEWSVSPRGNPLTLAGYLPMMRPLASAADGDALLARYAAFPAYVEGELENLRLGAADGWYANADSTRRTLKQLREELDKPLHERAAMAVSYAPEWGDRGDFDERLRAAVSEDVGPALARYADVVEAEILPNARPDGESGLSALPRGDACYEALVREYTTLDLTVDAVHQTGLDELARVHDEMRDLGEVLFGTREIPEIFDRLRVGERLYFDTSEAVEAKAVAALGAAREAMPAWFGRLPEADCVVRTVPEHEAPYTTIAYYRQPAADGSRPGEYYVNAYAPETRTLYEAEVLAYHESIPGHHLQIAIAQELPELPAFRRHMGTTAFVEGWGLYSERLADEMGLYTGDIDRMGMLGFDTWRAARLVVDTGMHAKGWTRAQAERFMQENTPLAPNNIENEVDRYLTTPGQALAYKIGQLQILRLRAEAEAALGDRFDVRAFHDVVLGGGAVPLGVLEERVGVWVAAQVALGPEAPDPGMGQPADISGWATQTGIASEEHVFMTGAHVASADFASPPLPAGVGRARCVVGVAAAADGRVERVVRLECEDPYFGALRDALRGTHWLPTLPFEEPPKTQFTLFHVFEAQRVVTVPTEPAPSEPSAAMAPDGIAGGVVGGVSVMGDGPRPVDGAVTVHHSALRFKARAVPKLPGSAGAGVDLRCVVAIDVGVDGAPVAVDFPSCAPELRDAAREAVFASAWYRPPSNAWGVPSRVQLVYDFSAAAH